MNIILQNNWNPIVTLPLFNRTLEEEVRWENLVIKDNEDKKGPQLSRIKCCSNLSGQLSSGTNYCNSESQHWAYGNSTHVIVAPGLMHTDLIAFRQKYIYISLLHEEQTEKLRETVPKTDHFEWIGVSVRQSRRLISQGLNIREASVNRVFLKLY